ncbi:MAG: carbohydrate binding domain-containing protein [Prevotellaceae bacterium]|nr:carbohydrate binding domain-containing protein [Candidatus Colivivens equi]
MKKYLSFLCMAFLAVVFYSCEDVPAPYEINNQGGRDNTIYKETFASSLGKWKNIVIAGEGGWKNDYSTACATGYDKTTKKTTPVTAYLVSPTISLEGVDTAHITYDYVLRYNKGNENQQIFIIDDSEYDITKSPADLVWTLLNNNHEETIDYNTFVSIAANIPAKFMGKKVRFAFFYNCPDNGSTWEVKNFKVLKGEADIPGPGPKPEGIIFDKVFETSLSPFINYTTSGAGEWINDYSTAKATGYDNASKKTTAGTYYLVSPEIDLAEIDSAYVDYNYILRYNKGDENQQLLITTSFDENNPAANWEVLNNKHTEGTDWATFANTQIAIPENYMGQKIRLALYYNTNATSGSTWEVKSLTVCKGTPGVGPQPVPGGGGTADNPFSVAQLQSLFDAGTIPTGTVYTRGIVSKIDDLSTSYGNATYYISDDGTTANQFEVYRGYSLDGAKFTSADQLQVGDSVVVYGTVVNYNNKTREYTTGSKLAYSSRLGGGGDKPVPPTPVNPKGSGTASDPYNIAMLLKLFADNQIPTGEIYFKGIVSKVKEVSIDFGNATYYVSDDGKSSNDFYVYRSKYLNGGKFTSANQIVVGDTVIVCGKVTLYMSTPETEQNNSYLYWTSNNGTTPTPPTPPTPSGGIKLSEFTNSGFENWTDDKTPAQWKSTTTASNATISKSTDAHGGNYSVLVEGNTSANKRLGSTEILLEAGEYTISFYAKGASGSSAASVRPGYVPVTDGKVGSYVYGNYTNDITDSEWIKVTHTFSLTSATTVNLVIMNPKNCGNLLIDDYTITKN